MERKIMFECPSSFVCLSKTSWHETFFADRTVRNTIGYWHNTVFYLSVYLSLTLYSAAKRYILLHAKVSEQVKKIGSSLRNTILQLLAPYPTDPEPRNTVNPAGDAGDTSPSIFWLQGTSVGISAPSLILLRTFGYSRPILVVLA